MINDCFRVTGAFHTVLDCGLSHMECDVNTSSNATTDCVQVCSMLHVVQVYVRRVIHVVIHNGVTDVEGLLVVVHTFP